MAGRFNPLQLETDDLGHRAAGAAYAVVLQIIQVGISYLFISWGRANLGSVWEVAAMLATLLFVNAIQTLIAAVAGGVWAGIVSLVTLPIVYLVVWSLKIRGSIIWLGAFCGGFVGFVATLPWLILIIAMAADAGTTIWITVLTLLFGPGLTTIIGQVGGAWGGRRAARDVVNQVARPRTNTDDAADEGEYPSSSIIPGDSFAALGARQPWLQFRIHHLMWVAFWLSVLLTAIRLCGIPFQYVLPLLAGWIVYQATTLWLGEKTVRWYLARQPAREGRST